MGFLPLLFLNLSTPATPTVPVETVTVQAPLPELFSLGGSTGAYSREYQRAVARYNAANNYNEVTSIAALYGNTEGQQERRQARIRDELAALEARSLELHQQILARTADLKRQLSSRLTELYGAV